MNIATKLMLTVVAFILIFSGGVTLMVTTIPGIALLGYVWGFNTAGGGK